MLIILKKIPVILLLFFSFSFVSCALDEGEISAASAILIDGDTNEILFEKDAYTKRSMASTTKIMTSLLAIESGKLDEIVTVKDKIYIEGTALGLNKGDKLTLEALCYGMLLESGNDAAVLTGIYLSGSEEEFSKLMNNKAAEIGMKNTNFVTASGLDDSEHYSTAYDMALLGSYAVKNSIFREICSTASYKAQYISSDKIQYFSNHNKLLKYCDGVFGIKTGFTKKSGRCLVSACERDGKVLVAVTLKAPDDWNDHKKLYEYGFSLYENKPVETPLIYSVSVSGSTKSNVKIKYLGNDTVTVKADSDIQYKFHLKSFYYAPIKTNDILGKLIIYQSGFPIKEQIIVAAEAADVIKETENKKQSLKQRFFIFIENLFKGW